MLAKEIQPTRIEQISSDVFLIDWSDGHQGMYFLKELRAKCPCATCREKKISFTELNPLRVLNENPNNFELSSWENVGRYAIALKWTDGHDTGIYTYEYLRELCQCDECTG